MPCPIRLSLYRRQAPCRSRHVKARGGTCQYAASGIEQELYGNVASLASVSPRFNDIEAGLRRNFTPAFFAGIAYNYTTNTGFQVHGNTRGNQQYNQVSVLADYFLSKRTDLYFTGAFQKASGTSTTGSEAVANIGGYGDSSNEHQAVFRFAIRHQFWYIASERNDIFHHVPDCRALTSGHHGVARTRCCAPRWSVLVAFLV
jgi:hypothetical protein